MAMKTPSRCLAECDPGPTQSPSPPMRSISSEVPVLFAPQAASQSSLPLTHGLTGWEQPPKTVAVEHLPQVIPC